MTPVRTDSFAYWQAEYLRLREVLGSARWTPDQKEAGLQGLLHVWASVRGETTNEAALMGAAMTGLLSEVARRLVWERARPEASC